MPAYLIEPRMPEGRGDRQPASSRRDASCPDPGPGRRELDPLVGRCPGLDYIATVPPTIALAADSFGKRSVGVIYGWVSASHIVGAAMAAFVAGLARDLVGHYAIAFIVAGWMAVAAGVEALTIRRRAPLATPAAAV
jgi:hypothetical protein